MRGVVRPLAVCVCGRVVVVVSVPAAAVVRLLVWWS